MFKKLLIDICIKVSIFSLADRNIGNSVELTFFEGKLGGIFVVKV